MRGTGWIFRGTGRGLKAEAGKILREGGGHAVKSDHGAQINCITSKTSQQS